MKKRVIFVSLLLAMTAFIIPVHGDETETEAEAPAQQVTDLAYTNKINLKYYSGTYSGEIRNNLPDGEGIFITDADAPEQFTYEGDFKDGLFDGNGLISLDSGISYESKFSSNLPTGRGTLYLSDHTYAKLSCSNGIPYGLYQLYSEEDEIIGYDFYYQGELISELLSQADTPDYADIYANPDQFWGEIFKIEGTVSFISENSTECTLRIMDNDGNTYWSDYSNTTFHRWYQAIIPTLQVGDKITLYGFYYGIDKYVASDDPGYSGFTYPRIDPFYADFLNKPAFDRLNAETDYETICAYPYHLYRTKITLTGTILNAIMEENASHYYYKLSTDENEIYYISVPIEDLNAIPLVNDTIKVTGRLAGQYKEISSDALAECLNIFPYLSATKIKVTK